MGNPGQKLWLMEKTTPILLLPLKAERLQQGWAFFLSLLLCKGAFLG